MTFIKSKKLSGADGWIQALRTRWASKKPDQSRRPLKAAYTVHNPFKEQGSLFIALSDSMKKTGKDSKGLVAGVMVDVSPKPIISDGVHVENIKVRNSTSRADVSHSQPESIYVSRA
jgi:hypothetical protein